jgi:hypothetical protein
MKICLTLLSVGMIAAAATAADRNYDVLNYTGNGLRQDKGQAFAAYKKAGEGWADVLYATEFTYYTTGVICTDMTGASMGQDGWSQYQTGSGNRWAIVTVTGGKAAKCSWGSNTASGAYSYLWQDNWGNGYANFTTGYGLEVDFTATRFSNTVSTNKGQTQLRTYDVSGTQTTIGFIFDNYATGTNPSIRGLAYLNTGSAATTGTYAFTLATGSEVTQTGTHAYYTAYNDTTGVVFWGWDAGPTSETGYFFDPTESGYINAAFQVAVNEVDFLNNRNSSTTVGNMNIDNITIQIQHNDFDCNGNGVPDWLEGIDGDNNGNGIPDSCDIASGLAKDCNGNGFIDAWDITMRTAQDCNLNSIPDSCDIASGTFKDCNNNRIPDSCDISSGALDLNHDGVLDICQGLSENDTTTSSLGIPTANTSVNTTFTGLTTPLTDATLIIRAKGDFDGGLAGLEYLNLKINNEANWQRLFETGGVNCSSSTNGGVSSATITIPLATFAQYAATGTMKVTLMPALSVTTGECADGSMTVELKYVSLNAGGDCDNDAQWDTLQISSNPTLDRNNNGHLDFCDIRDNPTLDHNNNGVLDSWEISQNASLDRNNNGQLDSWEISQNAALDRNNNGVLDSYDISQDASLDRNKNGVLDSWEISQNAALDHNGNGVLDSWEISQDPSLDRNLNGLFDSWEIAQNPLLDRNTNGVLDSYDCTQNPALDCNTNSQIDQYEILDNSGIDCNENNVIDACDIHAGAIDDNGDGRPDTCQRAKGDLDLSGEIDLGDIGILLLYMGEFNPVFGDYDGNGEIDSGDIGYIALNFGPVTWP